ncbi:MAG: hypothetical protein E6G92_10090 [Alphaproteobacteria bacterium]|nr:MAG: hypothetical protein E6G92_10090 [Alphaproteobacteria bacterium]
MVAPLALLGFCFALVFSHAFRVRLGLDQLSLHVGVGLMTIFVPLSWSYRAASRFFADAPVLAVQGGKLTGHWSIGGLPVKLSDILSVSIEQSFSRATGDSAFGFEPPYWLHIAVGGENPRAICLAPRQVLGGLLALRRFAEALRRRAEEWEKRPKERDIYDEIWGDADEPAAPVRP